MLASQAGVQWGALGRVWERLLEQHDGLRLRFELTEDGTDGAAERLAVARGRQLLDSPGVARGKQELRNDWR